MKSAGAPSPVHRLAGSWTFILGASTGAAPGVAAVLAMVAVGARMFPGVPAGSRAGIVNEWKPATLDEWKAFFLAVFGHGFSASLTLNMFRRFVCCVPPFAGGFDGINGRAILPPGPSRAIRRSNSQEPVPHG